MEPSDRPFQMSDSQIKSVDIEGIRFLICKKRSIGFHLFSDENQGESLSFAASDLDVKDKELELVLEIGTCFKALELVLEIGTCVRD